jgi:hypothetical protein
MTAQAILLPAAILVLWTLIMLGWMAMVRLPAMAKMNLDIAKLKPGGRGQDIDAVLPPHITWKAHNHTHLHEQPTLFYAIVAILAISGGVTSLTVGLAWAYTGLRIIHSIYQATINVVRVRFIIFLASSVCLIALSILTTITLLPR